MPLFLSSVVLFYVGVAFAYYVVFPLMFEFLASTTPVGVQMMTDISSYLDFVLLLFFAFGIAFEVPVAVVLLAATGLVKVESLRKHRGYVMLGIFIVAAILTPPDAVSQSFMADADVRAVRARHRVRAVPRAATGRRQGPARSGASG